MVLLFSKAPERFSELLFVGNVVIIETIDFSFLVNIDESPERLYYELDPVTEVSNNADTFSDCSDLLNESGVEIRSCCWAIIVFVSDTNNNENTTIIKLKPNIFNLLPLYMFNN